MKISSRAVRQFQGFGRIGNTNSREYLDKVILWTHDPDHDEIITTSDKVTVYGSEAGFFTEPDFKLVLRGKSSCVTAYTTAEQAWKASKKKVSDRGKTKPERLSKNNR